MGRTDRIGVERLGREEITLNGGKQLSFQTHQKEFAVERNKLDEGTRRLESQKKSWEDQKQFIENKIQFPERVSLNVVSSVFISIHSKGGEIFTTTLDTLQAFPESMIGAMFSGRFDLRKDSEGNYFIDRDPKCFRAFLVSHLTTGYILNFLRSGKINVPNDPCLRQELKNEAEFFQLHPLLSQLHPVDCQWKIHPFSYLKKGTKSRTQLWNSQPFLSHGLEWRARVEYPASWEGNDLRLWVGLFHMRYPERYSKLSLRFAYTFTVLDQSGYNHYLHSGHVRLLGPEFCALHTAPLSDTWISDDSIVLHVTIDTVSWEDQGRLDVDNSEGESHSSEWDSDDTESSKDSN